MASQAQASNNTPESQWLAEVRWEPGTRLVFQDSGKHEPDLPEQFPIAQRFFVMDRGSRLAPNYHEYLEIGYMAEGEAVLGCRDQELALGPGDVFVMGDNEFHQFLIRPEHTVRVVVLYFTSDLICCAGDSAADIGCIDVFRNHDQRFRYGISSAHRETRLIARKMGDIHREMQSLTLHYRLAVKNYLREILLTIARYHGAGAATLESQVERKAALDRLKPVLRMLLERHAEEVSVKAAAELAGMSLSYFCRYFRSVTGMTYTDYLTRLRIDKAKELLAEGKLPITTISAEVGFRNHGYFDRVFRRLNGSSPRDYSRRVSP